MSAITCSLNLFFIPHPYKKKTQVNLQYQLFSCLLVLINVKMLVMTKKKLVQMWANRLIIKMLDQQWLFWVSTRTLLVDALWRQSMLQINGCGRKSNAYS